MVTRVEINISMSKWFNMTHGSLEKKFYLIYTTTRRKQTNPFS